MMRKSYKCPTSKARMPKATFRTNLVLPAGNRLWRRWGTKLVSGSAFNDISLPGSKTNAIQWHISWSMSTYNENMVAEVKGGVPLLLEVAVCQSSWGGRSQKNAPCAASEWLALLRLRSQRTENCILLATSLKPCTRPKLMWPKEV